ncbi:hypothetical protein [Marispirochaeta sp.]|uniref:hypothetical protein n=1 Tax=Marispirochaeta sp. TaxID=2038653 RepID=UPI0029C77002|nr:hypothetical protein [Marispirochaeta sp.]
MILPTAGSRTFSPSAGLISLLALTAVSGSQALLLPILSAAAASGFLLLMRRFTARSIGLGDVKFAASSGVLLPGIQWLPAFCIASFAALLLFLPLYIGHRIGRRFRVPFGPFIGIGTISAVLLSAAGYMPPGF